MPNVDISLQSGTILSHVNCCIHGEVTGFQVLLDSLHPHSTRASWRPSPFLLASVSSGIHAVWPNSEKRRV